MSKGVVFTLPIFKSVFVYEVYECQTLKNINPFYRWKKSAIKAFIIILIAADVFCS